MQPDEVIWNIINHGHCSFKSKVARERTFCSNPYNVTGLCLRSACPLANSRYATIREEGGICYLYQKTAERAHTPKYLWEKTKLPANYAKALELVTKELEYFPKYLQHRNKQRLTKIHHMIIRMRKLKLQAKPKLTSTGSVVEKRERKKEAKALKAAVLERSIENELLERLKQVTDGEIYNYPEREYESALAKARTNFEKNGEGEDEELEEEDENEDEDDYNVEFVEGELDDDNDDDDDDEINGTDADLGEEDVLALYAKLQAKRKSKTKSKMKRSGVQEEGEGDRSKRSKPRISVEYEEEQEIDEDLEQRQREEQQRLSEMQFNF